MKTLALSLLMMMNYNSFSQNTNPKFKLNSIELDYLISGRTSTTSTQTDISKSFKGTESFNWQLGLDSASGGNFNYGSGSGGVKLSLGFIPYSNKKSAYHENQEIKLGLMSSGYNSVLSRGRNLTNNYRIDTITTLTISSVNNDTIISENYIDSTISYSESMKYQASELSLFLEWEFKTKFKKRVRLSIAPALKLTYLYQTTLEYSYRYSNYFNGNLHATGYENKMYQTKLLNRTSYKAKNGVAISPYINFSLSYKMSTKDNLLGAMHFITYGALGLNFNKIGGVKNVQLQKMYNFGVGLRYTI